VNLKNIPDDKLDEVQKLLQMQLDYKKKLISEHQADIDSNGIKPSRLPFQKCYNIKKLSQFWTKEISSMTWVKAWKPCFVCGQLPKNNMFGQLDKMLEVVDRYSTYILCKNHGDQLEKYRGKKGIVKGNKPKVVEKLSAKALDELIKELKCQILKTV
jgi:hypothetical protein